MKESSHTPVPPPRVLEDLEDFEHEQIVFCNDVKSGLRAIIAIHNTALGPSLGGTRMWNYTSRSEALTDVLRLSRGMSYKSALAGLPLGGGKAVILGDPKRDKNEAMLRAYGRFIEGLGGRFITGEDVGMSMADMDTLTRETRFAVGVSQCHGGSGDPGRFTAYGCLLGIRTSVREKLKRDSLKGVRVAVQGVGHVGHNLIRLLRDHDAEVIAADLDPDKCRRVCEEFGCEQTDAETILFVDCDVLSPCALGAVINDHTIDKLNCQIVAGSANNQLAESRHGTILFEKGILYAPDYAINSGGLHSVSLELEGYTREKAIRRINSISDVLDRIYNISSAEGIPPNQAADHIAKQRLESAKSNREKPWLSREHPTLFSGDTRTLPVNQQGLDLLG